MSVILDALRRAESQAGRSTPDQKTEPAQRLADRRGNKLDQALHRTDTHVQVAGEKSTMVRDGAALGLAMLAITVLAVSFVKITPTSIAEPETDGPVAARSFATVPLDELPTGVTQDHALNHSKDTILLEKRNDLRLTGIMRSGGQSRAIINDTMVCTGDTIDGAQVIQISSWGVRVKKHGEVFDLGLAEP